MAAALSAIGKASAPRIPILRRAACYDDWGAFEPPHLTFALTDTPFASDLAPCRRASTRLAPCPGPHAELTQSHHRLDPTIRSLHDRLAPAVSCIALLRFQFRRNRRRMRMGLGIDLGIFTSLAAEGNDDIAVVIGDLCRTASLRNPASASVWAGISPVLA